MKPKVEQYGITSAAAFVGATNAIGTPKEQSAANVEELTITLDGKPFLSENNRDGPMCLKKHLDPIPSDRRGKLNWTFSFRQEFCKSISSQWFAGGGRSVFLERLPFESE